MTYLLNNIDDAVDRKFLVTKTVNGQVEAGTVIHIMSASQDASGVVVGYRVTNSGQDYTANFGDLKEFSKWARPDSFIARYSENLTIKDIQQYIKIKNRTFTNFCLPIMAVAIIIIALISILALKEHITIAIIVAVCMSVLVGFLVFQFYKTQKTKFMTKLYGKISSNWAGGSIATH